MDNSKVTMKAEPGNKDEVGNDIDPALEQGKAEKITRDDLKGKKVDADPAEEQTETDAARKQ